MTVPVIYPAEPKSILMIGLGGGSSPKRLWRDFPHSRLEASGEAVGLPPGQMGNSEVGHLNLGAGRVVMQELVRIDRAIAAGELERNAVLRGLIEALEGIGRRSEIAMPPRKNSAMVVGSGTITSTPSLVVNWKGWPPMCPVQRPSP
jgi:hypothetical protein